MKIDAWTDVGCVRETNEDSFCVCQIGTGALLCAVADGMGGNEAGEVASSIAVQTIREHLEHGGDGGNEPGASLARAIEAANRAIWAAAREKPEYRGMGTTLTAILLAAEGAFLGHIGDSRAYLLRGEALQQLTEDHSLVGEMVKNGKLTEHGAMVHPQKNILTRALGTEESVRYDLRQIALQPGDKLILCTDGLSNLVDRNEIRDGAVRLPGVQGLARYLVETAKTRGGYDNITVVALAV